MFKISTLIAFCLLFTITSNAQSKNLSGKLLNDIEKKPIHNAVVTLLTVKDSFFYKFTRTDENGFFIIKNVDTGKYILMTTHNTYGDYLEDVEFKNSDVDLKEIKLLSKSKLLEQVIVKSGSSIRIKGDTTIYTVDSFKVSANANVEELLKKLPGIQVDKNGEIKAMGEKVEKVLVDGEEFFGDDPGMAVKNLRADALKEVQVFDKKSDQAEFTGIDDGNTQKTINLKLKDNKKKGYFGKIDASGGTQKNIDDRYNSNLLFSSFKGKRKLSAFLLNGNTGQDGLSWQDSEKFGGNNDSYSMNMDDNGEVSYQWTGGNGDEEPYIDINNGFIKNTNSGLQYSNKWDEKKTLNVSPKFNNQIYSNTKNWINQTQYGDSTLNESGNSATSMNRSNYKISASYDFKIDSSNTIKFSTKGNFYKTNSNELESTTTAGLNEVLKNSSNRTTYINSEKEYFLINILFKHKFKKARRTFSINSSWDLLNTESNVLLKSNNNVYKNALITSIQDLNQNKLSEKTTQSISANLVYTEPLSKKYALEISHAISSNKGSNNQNTYDYSNNSGKYDFLVDSLSNQFDQTITLNKPSIKISYNTKKIKYNFGNGFGFTKFDLLDKTFNKNYVRNYTNFFPSASFTYTYKSNHNVRINYNGYTQQPSLNDLQPLRNNNNYFNQFVGNPDLKPSFTNNIRVSHNSYNFLKEFSFYQSVDFSTVKNEITNSTIVDLDSGKTIIKPLNTNGNRNVNIYIGTWFKIKKIGLDVGFSPNIRFNKYVNYINNNINNSNVMNTGLSIYLSKSKDKKYDFSINNNLSNNRNANNQNDAIRKFNSLRVNIDATVYYKKTWSLSSDFNYNVRQKTNNFQNNLSNQIWNAKIQKTIKKDEFTFYLIVRDLLNKNIGIDRQFYENTISEVRNDRLKRYAMIGFTWNFKNKATANSK